MMVNNENLVHRLKSEDKDFKRWHDLHEQLENKLDHLNRRKFLTSEEEMERKKMQKQKLIAKDRIHLILTRYRQVN